MNKAKYENLYLQSCMLLGILERIDCGDSGPATPTCEELAPLKAAVLESEADLYEQV